MPLPKFSSRYPDVREVFDFALASGGARYSLPNPGQAIHWRARAYAFRKALWGELNHGSPSPSIHTPYDGIKITLEGSDCIIHVGTTVPKGVLSPLSGTEVLPGTSPVAEANEALSELESEAENLAKRLGIEL